MESCSLRCQEYNDVLYRQTGERGGQNLKEKADEENKMEFLKK